MVDKRPVKFENSWYTFKCPHCSIGIEVHKDDINCKIFRCGVYKKTYAPIPPHSTKKECDRLADNGLIHGCGKPFIFKGQYVEICDYI